MKKYTFIMNIVAIIFSLLTVMYGMNLVIQGEPTIGAVMITICDFTIAVACAFNWIMAKLGQI